MRHGASRGFTLVEVLVALMVVALGLDRADGRGQRHGAHQRLSARQDLAQWIALNRLTEVRLTVNKLGENQRQRAKIEFAGRTWHYDTRYFDTSFPSMKRVVVRV